MLVNADDSESEVEAETLRLRERDLSRVFYRTVSEDQKGDALTKRTPQQASASCGALDCPDGPRHAR